MSPGRCGRSRNDGALCGSVAEQRLDRAHRADQPRLRRVGHRGEQRGDLVVGRAIERCECLPSCGGQRELEPARVAGGRRLLQVTLVDESAQDAAQVPGIESQAAREIGSRHAARGVSELVEHAHLREGPGAVVQALAQHADPLRVEAVEAPHGVDARIRNRGHVPVSTNQLTLSTNSSAKYDSPMIDVGYRGSASSWREGGK